MAASEWATAIREAASFSESSQESQATSLLDRVSDGVVDERYYRLLRALWDADDEETVSVDAVLAQEQPGDRPLRDL